MGRPRKPLSELQNLGVFRPDRHANRLNEPQLDGVPQKPRGFDAEAAKLWDRIVPELVRRGIAKRIDAPFIAMTCELWSLYSKSVRLAHDAPTDREIHGAVTGYWTAFERAASKLGLTPADRAKLSVPPAPPKDDDIESFARNRSRA